MAEDLAELEDYLAAQIRRLGPAQRRKIGRKIGQVLRKENARRMAANVQPDGSAMEPRKRRKRMKDAKGRVKRTGKMFPKIRMAKALRIRATADEVEVGFTNRLIEKTASAHQFGLTDYVGRDGKGAVIRAQFPERQLLGFGEDDLREITDAVMAMLED